MQALGLKECAMDDLETVRQSGTITVGEDLYGLSLKELETRISVFEAEIIRVKHELKKKTQERNAADDLFGAKN